VLTSDRAKENKVVDSERQISSAEYQEIKRKRDRQNSRYHCPKTSKDREAHRCPIVKILLNKWQRQKEKRPDTLRQGLFEILRDE